MLLWEHPSLPRAKCPFTKGRDVWWGDAVGSQSPSCPPEWLDSEAPLFLLYTSGSTGKPKGVMHTTGRGPCPCRSLWALALLLPLQC